MNFMVLQTPDGASFKATPEQLGFAPLEGQYLLRVNNVGALAPDELFRVRDALERAAYRLAHAECWGQA